MPPDGNSQPADQRKAVAIDIAGQQIILDHSGAAWLPDTGDLLVADLHFEKGSAFAARGQGLLPPYDTAETLRRLERVCAQLKPRRVICLGDTLHDLAGEARMAESDRARLARLVAKQDWVWIAGNHDPEPPADFGGRAVGEMRVGDLVLRHDVFDSRGLFFLVGGIGSLVLLSAFAPGGVFVNHLGFASCDYFLHHP